MPILSPLTRPLLRSPLSAVGEGVGSSLNPASLFAGGIKGLALDLTNKGSLYQDSARTTLVSAAGDPIGSPSDLSGNGNHPTQATSTSRPVWQTTYAAFDGADDSWTTPAIDFTGTDKVTIVAGIRKASDAARGKLIELGDGTGTGFFYIDAPVTAGSNNFSALSGGSINVLPISSSTYVAPITVVLTMLGDIPNDVARLRINGVVDGDVSANQGTGAYRNDVVYIGRRAGTSLPFNGRIYRLLVIGRALSAAELAQAERWCANAAGVTLP